MKLDHLTILSSDSAASDAFYGALLPLLGFTRTKRNNWSDGDGFFLQFMKAKEGTRPYERYGAGLNHLGFGAPDRATVDRIRQAMIEAGFEIQPVQDLEGAYALFMPDPDGLRVEMSHYPPGVLFVD